MFILSASRVHASYTLLWKTENTPMANLRSRHEYQYLIEITNCQKAIVIELTKIKTTRNSICRI